MKPRTRNFPGNCSRANAYAAKTPTTSANSVTTTPMPTLLSSARPKWLPRFVLNAVLKLSNVTWVGHGDVSNVKPTLRKAVTTIQ